MKPTDLAIIIISTRINDEVSEPIDKDFDSLMRMVFDFD